ncbi:MAG: leucine efflux protein LeuE [Burkholderiaceae bacterium]
MIDLGVVRFWEFLLGTIIIVLLPGPNSLYVATVAARQGPARAWRAAFGIFTGDTVLILATAAGAASLIHLFPLAFEGFKIVGALYLGWIGYELLRSGWKQRRPDRPRVGDITTDSGALSAQAALTPDDSTISPAVLTASAAQAKLHQDPFFRALGLSLTNPKAILFFLAFFTQFVSPSAESVALAYFVLGVVVQIVSLSYLWMLIVAGHRLATQFEEHPRWAGAGLVLVGLFFIGFALRLMS